MLIQITNNCVENCPHCMQDSNPEGKSMSIQTFKKAISFGAYLGVHFFVITGGEPTRHPEFMKIMYILDHELDTLMSLTGENLLFTICSNGLWLRDEKFKNEWLKFADHASHIMDSQVYTNKLYYKDYQFVKYHGRRGDYDKYHFVFDESPLYCKDLGRARTSELAQREVIKSPYYCSCLNACLMAHQAETVRDWTEIFGTTSLFCHPLVDINGDVHMSESWLCPSIGNVNTNTYNQIWREMKKFKPCLKCSDSRKLLKSDNPKIKQACKLLELT